MKIKENYVLREIAGTYLVLPVGDKAMNATTMMTLNATGAFIWQQLETGCNLDTLTDALVAEYGISSEEARADACEFTEKLNLAGYLDSE